MWASRPYRVAALMRKRGLTRNSLASRLSDLNSWWKRARRSGPCPMSASSPHCVASFSSCGSRTVAPRPRPRDIGLDDSGQRVGSRRAQARGFGLPFLRKRARRQRDGHAIRTPNRDTSRAHILLFNNLDPEIAPVRVDAVRPPVEAEFSRICCGLTGRSKGRGNLDIPSDAVPARQCLAVERYTESNRDRSHLHRKPYISGAFAQGRQDSNLQPPVLETGALPIAPRPSVAARIVSAPSAVRITAVPLAALFTLITLAFRRRSRSGARRPRSGRSPSPRALSRPGWGRLPGPH